MKQRVTIARALVNNLKIVQALKRLEGVKEEVEPFIAIIAVNARYITRNEVKLSVTG